MLPALITIVSIYCCIRLWSSAAMLFQTSRTASAIFMILALLGSAMIVTQWLAVQQAGVQQADQQSALQERLQQLQGFGQ